MKLDHLVDSGSFGFLSTYLTEFVVAMEGQQKILIYRNP